MLCSWRNSRHKEKKRRKRISYHIAFVLMVHLGFPNPNLNLAEGWAWASEKGEWPQAVSGTCRQLCCSLLRCENQLPHCNAQDISVFALTARSHLTSMQLYLPSVVQICPSVFHLEALLGPSHVGSQITAAFMCKCLFIQRRMKPSSGQEPQTLGTHNAPHIFV